jgi:hypothetical protein
MTRLDQRPATRAADSRAPAQDHRPGSRQGVRTWGGLGGPGRRAERPGPATRPGPWWRDRPDWPPSNLRSLSRLRWWADCASPDSGCGDPARRVRRGGLASHQARCEYRRHIQSTGGEGCRETASALDPPTVLWPRRPLRAALTMNAIQSLGVRPSPLRLMTGSYVSSSSCQLLTGTAR